jgi:PAS domain S-box-containing protein
MDNPIVAEDFKKIVENISDVIYIVDLNENFVYINPSVKTLFGYDPEEVVGKKIYHFIMPQSYEKQEREFAEDLKERRFDKVEQLTMQVMHKNGGKIWVDVKAQFLKGPDGVPYAILGVARDVTDRVAAETELKSEISKLEN